MLIRTFRVTFDVIVDMDAVPEENKKEVDPKVLATGIIGTFEENNTKDLKMQFVSVEEINK